MDSKGSTQTPEKVLMAWSGGKDSAMALQSILSDDSLRVVALLTTITDGYDRITMHGVRVGLLEAQAEALGLPLEQVRIPVDCPDDVCDDLVGQSYKSHHARGVDRCVYGDLFLEDVRSYREAMLAELGMKGMYPLWGKGTAQMAREFVRQGFRTVITCVDPNQLDPSFCGRDFDEAFLDDLPEGVDPCGENGEFHSFVYDGPIFERPVAVKKGEVVHRGGFWYCDLLSLE